MLLSIVESLLLAASLCADCFAVSTCSSVTLEDISWRKILQIALAFGVVQTALMAMGWLFGGNKTSMVRPEDALPGRPERMAVAPRHAVHAA